MSIKRYKELVHFRSDAPLPPIQKKSNFNILKSGKSKFYSTNFTPSLLDIQYLQLLGKNNRLHTKLNTFINFYFLSGRGKHGFRLREKKSSKSFYFKSITRSVASDVGVEDYFYVVLSLWWIVRVFVIIARLQIYSWRGQ